MKAIYRIQNLKTGDFYIGSSTDYTYRKWCHLRDLRAGKHHSPILQNSWNKHGENAFLFAIVEETENLIEREQFYLDTLNPRYNICKKAGSPLGIKHTYEARLHMSLAHKGKKLSPESIRKRSESVRGSKRNNTTKGRISESNTLYRVLQYSMNGGFIKEWRNAREAADTLGFNVLKIQAACRGVIKTSRGFIWKYKPKNHES